MGTWNAYGNQYWPADYLIDAHGQVRYAAHRRGRLRQDRGGDPLACSPRPGAPRSVPDARPQDVVVPSRATSPETYLGTARADGWLAGQPKSGRHTYPGAEGDLALNRFAYGGEWTIGGAGGHRRRRRDDRRRGAGQERLPRPRLGGAQARGRSRSCSTGAR